MLDRLILHKKKAQTEMIGLVILVVLLTIAALFYVKFGILNQQPALDTSISLERAVFIAAAISKVEICLNTSLQEAISYCDLKQDVCGKNACDVIKKEVPSIIDVAFAGEFEISDTGVAANSKLVSFYVNQKDKTIVEVGKCPGKKGVVGSYPFKSDISGKEYIINYKLC